MTFGRFKDLIASRIFRRKPRQGTLLEYWEERAREFGPRAVLDMRHKPEEAEEVTRQQQQCLFPLLKQRLTGAERTVLDFGCGPGRFTGALADLIGGRAIGVDPIQTFLEMAPAHPRVEYRPLSAGRVPLEDEAADVVWVCLVLGGVPDGELPATVAEIRRVLKAGGLLFLVENTQVGVRSPHWTPRSINDYQALFLFLVLDHLDDYHDLGQRVSIFAGRKTVR
jgi:SAM-dependent methyltransferase